VSVPLVENPPEYDADAILAGEDQVREFCGWHVGPPKTETITVDGSGTSVLLLPTNYVTAISAIVENGVTIFGAPNYGYTWSENGIVERIGGVWTWKRRAIQVTLTHGYTTCPPAVRRAVAVLAAAAYATPTQLTEEAQAVLRPYELKSL
jgi:hypothetical protein